MELKAAITGNLTAYIKDQQQQAELAVTNGVKEITERIKQDLRSQVVSAGLGDRLSKTWRSQTYPRNQVSLSAAGVVKSKAPKIIAAFNDGVTIRSSQGKFLAIPTENAPKRGIGNKRISPMTFPEHRCGKLRFIYVNSGLSLLVTDQPNKRKKDANKTKVMFILVPQVKLGKRLDIQATVNKCTPLLPQAVLSNWPQDHAQ